MGLWRPESCSASPELPNFFIYIKEIEIPILFKPLLFGFSVICKHHIPKSSWILPDICQTGYLPPTPPFAVYAYFPYSAWVILNMAQDELCLTKTLTKYTY
jgi:hypothetical protein